MSYRGRLIFPMLARVYRRDAGTMSSDPDGDGVLTTGYDDDFREPARIDDGSQTGLAARVELEPVDIPAQVEDERFNTLSMESTGNDPTTTVILVFHFADLERLGYVDAVTRTATCPVIGDRLAAIVNRATREVEQAMPSGGLYCIAAEPRSYGLRGMRRNLLVATFAERGRAARVG